MSRAVLAIESPLLRGRTLAATLTHYLRAVNDVGSVGWVGLSDAKRRADADRPAPRAPRPARDRKGDPRGRRAAASRTPLPRGHGRAGDAAHRAQATCLLRALPRPLRPDAADRRAHRRRAVRDGRPLAEGQR